MQIKRHFFYLLEDSNSVWCHTCNRTMPNSGLHKTASQRKLIGENGEGLFSMR